MTATHLLILSAVRAEREESAGHQQRSLAHPGQRVHGQLCSFRRILQLLVGCRGYQHPPHQHVAYIS